MKKFGIIIALIFVFCGIFANSVQAQRHCRRPPIYQPRYVFRAPSCAPPVIRARCVRPVIVVRPACHEHTRKVIDYVDYWNGYCWVRETVVRYETYTCCMDCRY